MEACNTDTQAPKSAAPPLQARYKPGTVFKTGGKHPHECTVTDVLTTRNLAGEIVDIRYVATHQFLGQTVADRHVCDVTIARGLVSEAEDCLAVALEPNGTLAPQAMPDSWPQALPRLAAGQVIEVYILSIPTSQRREAPPCARFMVDQPFLEMLVHRMQMLKRIGLKAVAEPSELVEWPTGNEPEPTDNELRVHKTCFFWRGSYDWSDMAVETRSIELLPDERIPGDSLAEALTTALADGKTQVALHLSLDDALGYFDEE
jgi:hypothetical protein